jgi:ubiquinone/menaquinone biosynthesis C-methylase UbiE
MWRALLPLLLVSAVSAQEHHGQHGNPSDLDGYIAHLEDPGRAEWQKPDEVVASLELRTGDTACDVGAGPGYFTLRLARAVGPEGRVLAVDVETRMVETLRERLVSAKLTNVTPILSLPDDSLLPGGACDVVLVVDTYHHFPDGLDYLRRLSRALKAGGRIVNIDYQKRDTPVGPPLEHRVARESFLEVAGRAGLVLAEEKTLLPYQYFLILRPR